MLLINLKRHIENVSKYTKNIVVAINKFETDTNDEINYVKDCVESMGYKVGVCTSFKEGSSGATDIAKKVIEVCNNNVDFKPLYSFDEHIIDKINKICMKIYRADNIIISDEIKEKIIYLEENGFGNLPVCIAKTQYSFGDDAKMLGAPTNFNMTVRDIKLSSGAGFIIVLMGNIMTMPGLGKNSAYLNMDIDSNGNITGLF